MSSIQSFSLTPATSWAEFTNSLPSSVYFTLSVGYIFTETHLKEMVTDLKNERIKILIFAKLDNITCVILTDNLAIDSRLLHLNICKIESQIIDDIESNITDSQTLTFGKIIDEWKTKFSELQKPKYLI